MELNETTIQRVIMGENYRQGFCLPNYTPRGWWECDVFATTAAGYFREYEIKLSVTDFKKDRKKSARPYRLGEKSGWGKPSIGKHELLSKGDPRGPVQFWYVTPPGLLFPEPVENGNPEAVVPPWAGLIEICAQGHWLRPREVKAAPRLHGEKFSQKRLDHARSVTYWRMHSLLKTHEWVMAEKDTTDDNR